jgi:tetratricopeptide (TPR) repeat protein
MGRGRVGYQVVCVIALGLMSGCEPPTPPAQWVTAPASATEEIKMSISDARKNVAALLPRELNSHWARQIEGFNRSEFSGIARSKSTGASEKFTISFAPARYGVCYIPEFDPGVAAFSALTTCTRAGSTVFGVHFTNRNDAVVFANSMNRLIQAATTDIARRRSAASALDARAGDCAAKGSPLVLPEPARAKGVLGAAAYRDKKFEDALDYYREGVQIEPCWPEGNFNAALLAGELEEYEEAAQYMRRYLVLVPASADAQVAKDKILVWDERARRGR